MNRILGALALGIAFTPLFAAPGANQPNPCGAGKLNATTFARFTKNSAWLSDDEIKALSKLRILTGPNGWSKGNYEFAEELSYPKNSDDVSAALSEICKMRRAANGGQAGENDARALLKDLKDINGYSEINPNLADRYLKQRTTDDSLRRQIDDQYRRVYEMALRPGQNPRVARELAKVYDEKTQFQIAAAVQADIKRKAAKIGEQLDAEAAAQRAAAAAGILQNDQLSSNGGTGVAAANAGANCGEYCEHYSNMLCNEHLGALTPCGQLKKRYPGCPACR